MKLFVLALSFFLASISAYADNEHSDATLDSSRPLSDGLKSYNVEHYTLRT